MTNPTTRAVADLTGVEVRTAPLVWCDAASGPADVAVNLVRGSTARYCQGTLTGLTADTAYSYQLLLDEQVRSRGTIPYAHRTPVNDAGGYTVDTGPWSIDTKTGDHGVVCVDVTAATSGPPEDSAEESLS